MFIPKSTKMVPRDALEWSWKQVGSKLPKKTLNLPRIVEILASLRRYGTPFGRKVGATGVSISSMLAPGCLKMLKNEVPEGIPEKT